jgi:hypothetical protein
MVLLPGRQVLFAGYAKLHFALSYLIGPRGRRGVSVLGKLFLNCEASEGELLHIHPVAHHVADECLLVHSGVGEEVEELGGEMSTSLIRYCCIFLGCFPM